MTQRLLGLILARQGSKRVPNKNIRPFAGSSLLELSIRHAQASTSLDGLGLSTDSPEYLCLAQQAGLAETYLRPAHIADDQTSSADTVLDYLDWLCLHGQSQFTHVVLLQPTSPFRTSDIIDKAIGAWRQSDRSSLVSVTPAAPSHNFLVHHDIDGKLRTLASSLDPIFVLEGSLYVTPVEQLRQTKRFWNEDSLPYVINHPRPYDIDTTADMSAAERLVEGSFIGMPCTK